ncbi:hypothetical protein LOKO_01323 [Halomonas chromatireducens]|uniref:Uncharacterized protein n=1 Tax=Halomonas chromatireducens TaxID=507626 RepID=A0A0X8HD29_9GAMM|nr:hypothetical protein LOKO_01323 [Halomonas chromatireducens]
MGEKNANKSDNKTNHYQSFIFPSHEISSSSRQSIIKCYHGHYVCKKYR